MKRFNLIVAIIIITSLSINAQQMFKKYSGQDIGNPKLKGSFQFDEKMQKFTLGGAGYNLWFARDEFYFVSQEMEGDFIISANLKFIGEGTDPHRKIGLMIRNSNAENAVYMDGAVHGDGLTSLQYREKTDAETLEKAAGKKEIPDFVQLERKGDEFIFRISKNGNPLVEVAKVKLEMGKSVLTGMFIGSHNVDVVEKAEFWNVRIEKPAAEGTDGYKNLSPSRLEILNVETGIREVIYETETHIEAPNWSRDGKFLIYNSGGKLYKFNLKDSKISEINTGDVVANNNDHGISFDGKMLAISSSAPVENGNASVVFTVPVEGGTPTRITEKGPSYWHGWSPDGNWLTYCAERNGNYDVYKIPAKGGKEIRLTTAEGLDDGPEFSPDGKYIYFNSTRTGMMQIWRMKTDGTEQEQITFDNYQNWFAHPSPDGKQMIIISYPPEVPATSHPHNQRIMLRLMPVDGGEIKVAAFLYGGQGTINVPSWNPESKRVAFVSYTY
ncbi:MAG TPA: biopolymer transporter TolR [Draconibacterium sp.]|nr:biopolymer transporter TolR [Draconibacterium sp.]HRX11213.1 biopolymer transporter TolR [Draconibacterium sp.]